MVLLSLRGAEAPKLMDGSEAMRLGRGELTRRAALMRVPQAAALGQRGAEGLSHGAEPAAGLRIAARPSMD